MTGISYCLRASSTAPEISEWKSRKRLDFLAGLRSDSVSGPFAEIHFMTFASAGFFFDDKIVCMRSSWLIAICANDMASDHWSTLSPTVAALNRYLTPADALVSMSGRHGRCVRLTPQICRSKWSISSRYFRTVIG